MSGGLTTGDTHGGYPVTHAEKIYNYLWSIAPDGATNAELARQLSIASHQTVYMMTQELLRRGLLRGEQDGRTGASMPWSRRT